MTGKLTKLPPFQQEKAKEDYLGLRLNLFGEFYRAESKGEMISFSFSALMNGDKGPLVFCDVSEREAPLLKVADSGWHIRVQGTLVRFDKFAVHLDDVRILSLREKSDDSE